MTNEKVAVINVKLKTFFIRWLDVLKPWHSLNNQQQQVLSLLLYYHYIYKKDITNNKILWKIVFDYDTRLKITEDEIFKKGMTTNTLNNIFTVLRKKGVIIDNKISNVYIPELNNESKAFKMTFNFNIIDNE
jgi:hypothetical protein